jgi:hypothetical protein
MANSSVSQDTERAHERLQVAQLEIFSAWCDVYWGDEDARAVRDVLARVRRRAQSA